jgi:hypothetical protein
VRVIKADLAKIWEAGEAEAPLRINGAEVAKLVAVKYRLPFGVKVDAPDPDKPEFTLQRNQVYDVVLKNEDAVTYRIHWNFHLAGQTSQGDLVVTPRSTAKFMVSSRQNDYTWTTGLLKDHEENGKLTLSFSPPDVKNASYWPSKVIPVKARLRSASETTRAWLVNGVLLSVLVAGALFSYLASVGLPNRLKRSEYHESLAELGQRIVGISSQVDSRMRVVVRVQGRRLARLLDSRKNISPDLTRVFNQVSQGLTTLEKQVSLAEQIDAAHRRLKLLDTKGAPPSLLEETEEAVWKAAEEISQLNPEERELERSKGYLDRAASSMEKAEQYSKEFADKLVERASRIKEELDPYLNDPLYADKIKPALGSVFDDLAAPATEPKTPEAAAWHDQILIKRELVRQFLQIYHATQDPLIRPKLDAQLSRLLTTLGLESYKAMRHARLLVREAQEGIYREDLLNAGKTERIEIDPAVPQTYDPVRFSLRFGDQRLNDAAARLEFEGRWEFGHGADRYRETGWDPVHYFPEDKTYDVTFCFGGGAEGEALTLKREVTAKKQNDFWFKRDRDRAEAVRFCVTLLPAIVGLLSGAREQFLKMDVPSALFAVFLLGFTSDTVKNLISKSQQAPNPAPAATPTAAAKAQNPPPAAKDTSTANVARRV